MIKYTIFDMDGTLANTAPGIISSFLHVAHELGIPEPTKEALYAVRGGSLIDDMVKLYGISRDEAIEASLSLSSAATATHWFFTIAPLAST